METNKIIKSNAENNRAYRARKGEEINARRREQRNRNRAIETVKIEYEVRELKKADKLPVRKEGEGIGEQTKRNYVAYIKKFHRRYKGEELEDEDDIIKKIEGKEYSAMKVSRRFKDIIEDKMVEIKGNPLDVKNIYSIFRGIRGFTEISKELYPYLKDYAEQYDEKRSEIVVLSEDIRFEREEIKGNLNKLEDKIDKIIYGYIMILNGRVHDLRYTKISVKEEELKDEGYNYIYEGKYYINNTKNKKKQILDIEEDFKELYEGVGEGYLLGGLMPASTLTHRIQRITEKIYGKVYTASNIRHLFATYINNKGSSYKERKETAKKAGHSIDQQIKYVYREKE
jgi:hypothetical protein